MALQPYELLENDISRWCGVRSAVCSTGTAALHLALEALREKRCKVIVPDYQFVAVARAVSMAGMIPVFVDVCSHDCNIDVGEVLRVVSRDPEIGGLIAVHTYGRRAPMDALRRIAVQHDLFVVEDLSQAHGIRPHNGSDAACWSFFRNKVVPAEEGGAVASQFPEVIDAVKCLRSQGYREGAFWNHEPRGVNARMTNAQALMIHRNLLIIEELLYTRKQIAGYHDDCCPAGWDLPARAVNWLYDFRIPGLKMEQQQRIVQSVNRAGIYCRPGFKPLRKMDEYRVGEHCSFVAEKEWVSDVLSREVIALDCSPLTMSKETVQKAWRAIRAEI